MVPNDPPGLMGLKIKTKSQSLGIVGKRFMNGSSEFGHPGLCVPGPDRVNASYNLLIHLLSWLS